MQRDNRKSRALHVLFIVEVADDEIALGQMPRGFDATARPYGLSWWYFGSMVEPMTTCFLSNFKIDVSSATNAARAGVTARTVCRIPGQRVGATAAAGHEQRGNGRDRDAFHPRNISRRMRKRL